MAEQSCTLRDWRGHGRGRALALSQKPRRDLSRLSGPGEEPGSPLLGEQWCGRRRRHSDNRTSSEGPRRPGEEGSAPVSHRGFGFGFGLGHTGLGQEGETQPHRGCFGGGGAASRSLRWPGPLTEGWGVTVAVPRDGALAYGFEESLGGCRIWGWRLAARVWAPGGSSESGGFLSPGLVSLPGDGQERVSRAPLSPLWSACPPCSKLRGGWACGVSPPSCLPLARPQMSGPGRVSPRCQEPGNTPEVLMEGTFPPPCLPSPFFPPSLPPPFSFSVVVVVVIVVGGLGLRDGEGGCRREF